MILDNPLLDYKLVRERLLHWSLRVWSNRHERVYVMAFAIPGGFGVAADDRSKEAGLVLASPFSAEAEITAALEDVRTGRTVYTFNCDGVAGALDMVRTVRLDVIHERPILYLDDLHDGWGTTYWAVGVQP